ncbi:MAG: S8/S53 family peptidase [Sciscionella sp.]|nr:S8/S53 family peptidase [Sciscionella sp.]
MKTSHRNSLITLTSAATVALGVLIAPAASADEATTTTTLTNEVLPGLSGLTAQGAAPASQQMQLAVVVSGNQAAAQQAYQAIYTPGSPQYHHFLTPTQIADQFGAPTDRWQAAQSWLKGNGLTVGYASGTRDLILVTGPVSAVEHTFGVQLDSYRTGTRDFLANTSAPKVPTSLGITNVVGLNTLDGAVPSRPRTSAAGVGGTVTAKELWGAYQQPADDEGAGQSVGVLGEGATDTVLSDLTKFEDKNGFGHVPVTVQHVGSGPYTDTSGQVEWDMDTQSMVGMAPKTDGVTMYFGKDLTDTTGAALISAWESDPNGPKQADASWGECEETPLDKPLAPIINPVNQLLGGLQAGVGLQDDLEAVADPILQKATLQGKTLFVSTGDTGSSCPVVYVPVVGAGNGLVNQIVPFTNYPASSPYAVGVGGTTLSVNGTDQNATRDQENAWAFGGGGETFFTDAPGYQQGVQNLNLPGSDGKVARGIPDVAAMSGDGITNGYDMISSGSDTTGGGTSLSSPLWVGMWSRVQSATGGLGFANETFYRLGKNATTYKRDFYDITTGVGGVPVVGNGLYTTQTGWDYASGWGTPKLTNLIADAKQQ